MASPAATILGAPLAFSVGASRARAHGVQLRDLDTVRATSRLDTLVLEKDGTVTTGDLTVVSVEPVEPDHDRNLRWFAGALEKASDHRVGRAVATLSARGQLSDVEVVDGLGIRGSVDRHPVRVGSPDWIGIDIRPTIWTTVGVEVDGRALGSITVADDVRPDLTRDVARLTALGLDLVLVSGDGDERTRHVAGLAGISQFHSACDAARTGEVVRSLVADGLVVATVGTTASDGATLAFTTPDEPVAGRPVIVVDDLAPARIADAVEAARATGWRVRRSGRVAVLLGALGVAAALTGVAGAVVMAATAAGIAAVTAAVATSG
nr:HAD family hydrolase [Aeromicrobium stalagmiti]